MCERPGFLRFRIPASLAGLFNLQPSTKGKMSHFTEIKTQIKDIEALRSLCQEIGLGLLENAEARGYYENKTKGDYVIRLKGPMTLPGTSNRTARSGSLPASGRATWRTKSPRARLASVNSACQLSGCLCAFVRKPVRQSIPPAIQPSLLAYLHRCFLGIVRDPIQLATWRRRYSAVRR